MLCLSVFVLVGERGKRCGKGVVGLGGIVLSGCGGLLFFVCFVSSLCSARAKVTGILPLLGARPESQRSVKSCSVWEDLQLYDVARVSVMGTQRLVMVCPANREAACCL